MALSIGINGFGRIGRSLFRLLHGRDDLRLVAINDVLAPDTLEYLARYDTVLGRFPGRLALADDGRALAVDDARIRLSRERAPGDIPWRESGVDVVIESTGVFRARADFEGHLAAGTDRVVVTFPLVSGEADATIITGLNHTTLTPEHRIISNTSCTAHCFGPLLVVLDDAFGVEAVSMTTVHAYTSAQNIVDGPHEGDLRRGRAGADNIVPTTTGAVEAVEAVLPQFAGRIVGMAQRVPVLNGSNVDLTVLVRDATDVAAVNGALKRAAESGPLAPYLAYTEDPLVSADIVGDPHSAIVDGALTAVVGGTLVRVVAWYDNEWGYTNRLADLLAHLATV